MNAPERFEALREVETAWLSAELGRAISNLGYPVGMGMAPHPETLDAAASKLFNRYAEMFRHLSEVSK